MPSNLYLLIHKATPFGKFTKLYIQLWKHDNLARTVEYTFITGTNLPINQLKIK